MAGLEERGACRFSLNQQFGLLLTQGLRLATYIPERLPVLLDVSAELLLGANEVVIV